MSWSRVAFLVLAIGLAAPPGQAAELSIVSGSAGLDLEVLRAQLDQFEKASGNKVNIVARPASSTDQFADYKLWLAAQNSEIDVYRADVVWAPQLAVQFIDLSSDTGDVVGQHFADLIAAQTVNGRLVALPLFADAPALFYRRDLLDKYGFKPPTTWSEMTATAKTIMDKERAAGNAALWGYVFQGAAYEGLTCNALEWIASNGGGAIVEPDGSISIDNPNAAAALDMARGWVGTISPPEVINFTEEDARAVWQAGNAVFMRNWPYAVALSNADDSAVKGNFDIAPLPAGTGGKSTATLGGWNLALSRYTRHRPEAIALIKFLTAADAQKYRAVKAADLPTMQALYDDADIAAEQPWMKRWQDIMQSATPRPSAVTGRKYNEVSQAFWNAVHETLAGRGTGAENLTALRTQLERLKGSEW